MREEDLRQTTIMRKYAEQKVEVQLSNAISKLNKLEKQRIVINQQIDSTKKVIGRLKNASNS